MKHYHFEVQGFKRGKPPLELTDIAIIEVLALTEKEAIKRAKDILVKPEYRIGKVFECHYSEFDQAEQKEMQVLQLEMQSKLLKNI